MTRSPHTRLRGCSSATAGVLTGGISSETLGGPLIDRWALPFELALAVPDGVSDDWPRSFGFDEGKWLSSFYASLSPGEMTKAYTTEGVTLADMSQWQRQQALAYIHHQPAPPSLEEAKQVVFTIVDRLSETGGRPITHTYLHFKWPSGYTMAARP